MRWSDGTWLEDQDYWHISGIFRSVRLFAKPQIHILDWFIQAVPDEHGDGAVLRANVQIRELTGFADHKVKIQLLDADGAVVAQAEGKYDVGFGWTLPRRAGVVLEMAIKSVRKWTPETPYLYTPCLR